MGSNFIHETTKEAVQNFMDMWMCKPLTCRQNRLTTGPGQSPSYNLTTQLNSPVVEILSMLNVRIFTRAHFLTDND